jgi:hypothetical protein
VKAVTHRVDRIRRVSGEYSIRRSLRTSRPSSSGEARSSALVPIQFSLPIGGDRRAPGVPVDRHRHGRPPARAKRGDLLVGHGNASGRLADRSGLGATLYDSLLVLMCTFIWERTALAPARVPVRGWWWNGLAQRPLSRRRKSISSAFRSSGRSC